MLLRAIVGFVFAIAIAPFAAEARPFAPEEKAAIRAVFDENAQAYSAFDFKRVASNSIPTKMLQLLAKEEGVGADELLSMVGDQIKASLGSSADGQTLEAEFDAPLDDIDAQEFVSPGGERFVWAYAPIKFNFGSGRRKLTADIQGILLQDGDRWFHVASGVDEILEEVYPFLKGAKGASAAASTPQP
jgi:hypothetical protein